MQVKAIHENDEIRAFCPYCGTLNVVRRDADGGWTRRRAICEHLRKPWIGDVDAHGVVLRVIFTGEFTKPSITPGPWFYREGVVTDSQGQALMAGTFDGAKAVNNARLAAAAPEMYEVLMTMVRERATGCDSYDTLHRALNILRKVGE